MTSAAEKGKLLEEAPRLIARAKHLGLIRERGELTPEQASSLKQFGSSVPYLRRKAEQAGDLVALSKLPPPKHKRKEKQ